MFNIKDFLSRMKSVQAGGYLLRQAVQEAVKRHAGIDLDPENIVMKGSEVILKGISSAARSVIFIKRQKILDDLNDSQKPQIFTHIK